MKVIATTDLSKEGNDCYIYKSVSLVKEFDLPYEFPEEVKKEALEKSFGERL